MQQTTLLPARLIYTPSAFVQQVCRAQRRYSFFISTRNNTIFEKRGKGKRIERDELKEANIHAKRRVERIRRRGASSKEEKNWRKNMLATRQTRERPLHDEASSFFAKEISSLKSFYGTLNYRIL